MSEYVNGDIEEIWKINRKFIDNQKALGKEIYLSHNPFDENFYKGFYKRELNHLTGSNLSKKFGGKIEQISENLWKVNY